MTQSETSAEAMENAVLPKLHDNHTANPKGGRHEDLPKALQESPAQKSPAQWAY
jgi:hypothetical protein